MSDSFQKGSVTYVRRREAKLPSVKRHVGRAFTIILLSTAAIAAGFHFLGNPEDAKAVGQVSIEPLPLPEASDNLNGDGTALPDLLDGLPQNVNPTENLGSLQIDALGNPINSDLAGANSAPNQATNAPLPEYTSTGPKTILIDGQPVGGGAFPTSALPRAPFSDITRSSPYGRVPTISSTGKKAVTSYARPFSPTAGKSQVAVIIGGLGIDRNLTRRMINETPPEVTLSFAAHANGLQTMINQARERGHEVMIELPMEGHNFNPSEPGSDRALKTDNSAAINIRNLDWLMSRGQGFFAVTNYNGGKLITRNDVMAPILAHLSDSGLGFLYDGSESSGALPALSASSNLPYAEAFSIIDNQSDIAAIKSELDQLNTISSASAPQIGIGFALPETLLAVKGWVADLENSNSELAPASFVLNR